jgi:Ca2+-binding EF-hand superfamily protein
VLEKARVGSNGSGRRHAGMAAQGRAVMRDRRGLALGCGLHADSIALLLFFLLLFELPGGGHVAEANGVGQSYEDGLDEGDWADEMGYQSDPAYEQYAERLQQQLESLRKEHDEIFGRADSNKDGAMSKEEYYAMHREAEQGDDKNAYDDKELARAFSDLDKDSSDSLSLDEWRRPFEEHTDAWLQIADTEAQQEAQIAHYKEVFNQMDWKGDGVLDEQELQYEMDSLQAHRQASDYGDGLGGRDGDSVVQLSGADMLLMMDADRNGRVTFEEYLLGGEQQVA